MVHAPTPLRCLLITLSVCIAAVTNATAQTQLQTPTLAAAWPNRVDVGDTVTLIGTQLDQSGTTLAVTLGGVACPVTRRTDTAVDITIPAGARSGEAVVSETMQLPDGTSTTVSSNGVPLLVVWTFLDTIGLGPHWSGVTPNNVVTPGPADSVGFCVGGKDFFGGYETDIYTMRHDRSIVMVARNFQDWLSGSLVAIDPLNGDVIAAVTVWTYSSFTQYLKNLSTGATLFQFPHEPHGQTLQPMAVRFDSAGVMYVAVRDQDDLTSVFRFAPGDAIVFDVNGPSNMTQGGVPLTGSWWASSGDMAVAGNGTVSYIPCSLAPPGDTMSVLRVPGSSGAVFDTLQLPDLGYTDGTLWYLGARCNGQMLAAGASWGGNSPVSLVDLTDGSVIASITGLIRLRGFGTDGYDNLYVHGLMPVGGVNTWGLRRLTVGDLPSGFYGPPPAGVAAAAMHASALFSTPADPATIPPQWLVKRRKPLRVKPLPSPQLQPSPAAPGTSGTAPTTTPPTAPVQLAGSTQAGVKATGVLPVLPSAFCVPNARLAVEIDGTYRVDGDKATILLGKELDLKAVWYAGLNPVSPVDVHWTLQDTSTSWQQEHENAANGGLVESVAASEKGVLFPDDVLLLFDEVDPGQTAPAAPDRKIWPIHTGTVVLKLHADATPGGGPADLSVTITVSYAQSQLGTAHNDLDAFINPWANAFGVPPQYIKGLVEQESTRTFNAEAFRYEPAKWDFGNNHGGGIKDHLTDAYFAPFRFEEPGGIKETGNQPLGRGPSLLQGDIDGRTKGQQLYTLMGVPGACQAVVPGQSTVSTWQLYLGSNGYFDDTSYPPAPCGQRMNWEPIANIYTWDSDRRTQTPVGAADATWWFYQHQDYAAQTFLAASYGLTQVGYRTALKGMSWLSSQPDRRHWANVVNPNTNIYLGARWLAWPAWLRISSVAKLSKSASHHETAFTSLVKRFLCTYNEGVPKPTVVLQSAKCDYAGSIAGYAQTFTPYQEGTQ